MSIVYCAECEGKVSGRLLACPHCGHPLTGQGDPVAVRPVGVQTTQKTGKGLKFFKGVGTVMMVVCGIAWLTSDNPGPPAAYYCGLGAFIWLGATFFAWWRHG
jgi:hypothetical protein